MLIKHVCPWLYDIFILYRYVVLVVTIHIYIYWYIMVSWYIAPLSPFTRGSSSEVMMCGETNAGNLNIYVRGCWAPVAVSQCRWLGLNWVVITSGVKWKWYVNIIVCDETVRSTQAIGRKVLNVRCQNPCSCELENPSNLSVDVNVYRLQPNFKQMKDKERVYFF